MVHKFKNTGVRVLENEVGDILICDRNIKADTLILSESIRFAEVDEKTAQFIGLQVVRFLREQRQARVKIASKKIDLLEKLDKRFAHNMRYHLKKDNLRKVEKDIHFFVNTNPEIGEEMERII
jgi:hypothetical protein